MVANSSAVAMEGCRCSGFKITRIIFCRCSTYVSSVLRSSLRCIRLAPRFWIVLLCDSGAGTVVVEECEDCLDGVSIGALFRFVLILFAGGLLELSSDRARFVGVRRLFFSEELQNASTFLNLALPVGIVWRVLSVGTDLSQAVQGMFQGVDGNLNV